MFFFSETRATCNMPAYFTILLHSLIRPTSSNRSLIIASLQSLPSGVNKDALPVFRRDIRYASRASLLNAAGN